MKKLFFLLSVIILAACSSDDNNTPTNEEPLADLSEYFTIDFDNLPNYANQTVPNYITKDNTPPNNPITDEGAALGRVLFYDTGLSVDNSVACASCHKQEFAFSDDNDVSTGVDGVTPRHSMRLINARFSDESMFFWDERAVSLEDQTTQPIQDHVEMGFSGAGGDPSFDDLITRMETTEYYPELFRKAFGDPQITETRMQNALAQFVRSIQSFDSKYDEGRALVNNDNDPFPNFTAEENDGKNLFIAPPQFNGIGERIAGGVGCAGCHRIPEFDIDPNSMNNGVIGVFDSGDQDITVTRAPSLRDVVNGSGVPNGAFFHDSSAGTLAEVIAHYNEITQENAQLDMRLRPGGDLQNLNMTAQEINDLIAFIQTLTGEDVYTNEKWSDPFIE